MPTRIIETDPQPFRKVEIDPVTLDIIENALRNARVEMDTTLVRTAMSPGIREQGDAFPLIADHKGRMIVGQFGSYIGPFLEGYEGTLEDGDMIFLSDPYSVGGAISHSNDWLVLLPVFKDGRLIAYTSMFGHQSDIGGMVPGSMPGMLVRPKNSSRMPPVLSKSCTSRERPAVVPTCTDLTRPSTVTFCFQVTSWIGVTPSADCGSGFVSGWASSGDDLARKSRRYRRGRGPHRGLPKI